MHIWLISLSKERKKFASKNLEVHYAAILRFAFGIEKQSTEWYDRRSSRGSFYCSVQMLADVWLSIAVDVPTLHMAKGNEVMLTMLEWSSEQEIRTFQIHFSQHPG